MSQKITFGSLGKTGEPLRETIYDMPPAIPDDQESLGAWEKFIRNIPLTPELAALKSGVEPEEEPDRSGYIRAGFQGPGRPMTRDEARELGSLRDLPGWLILMKRLDNEIATHRAAAISLSETDPVGNAEEAKKFWLYVNSYTWVRRKLDDLIDEALRARRPQPKGVTGDEEILESD